MQIVDWEMKRNHIEAVKEFLIPIQRGEIPEGVAFGYDHIATMFPETEDVAVELDPTVLEMVDLLEKAKSHKNHWEKEEDRVKALIAEQLGSATTGTVDGNTLVTWKQQSRTSLDTKALNAAHPGLLDQFQKSSTFRVLRISRKGK